MTKEDRVERLVSFGQELKTRRLSLGLDGKVFAPKIGISAQYLSELEKAANKGGRGPATPGDEVLEAISIVLNWSLFDIRRMLGQLPSEQLHTYSLPSPATALIREIADSMKIINLTESEMDALITRIEGFAEFELQRVAAADRKQNAEPGDDKLNPA